MGRGGEAVTSLYVYMYYKTCRNCIWHCCIILQPFRLFLYMCLSLMVSIVCDICLGGGVGHTK